MNEKAENHDNCSCSQNLRTKSLEQTLTELDFERGIWNAAIYNERTKINDFIRKGKTMDRDNFGYTALHYAARNGHEAICQLLIKTGGADINATTNGGATALHRAAMMGHLNIVKLLISSNADVTIQDADGQTSLHRAALKGFYSVSKQLIETSNKLKSIKDKNNKIPFNLIPMNANDDLKSLLKP